MKPEKDILSEALEQLKNEPMEPGPPQAVVDATLKDLASDGINERPQATTYVKLITKVTAAAAIFVLLGYAIGRLSAPKAPDLEQLKAELTGSLTTSIEPLVRQNVMAEMRRQWQVAMTKGFTQIKEDLAQQYQTDLNRFAVQLLAASNARTNQILGQLVQNIKTAETQKMKWVTGALQEIDRTHRQEQSQLAAGLEALAYQTKDGFQQTREELVQLLVNTYPSTTPLNVEEKKESQGL